MQAKTFTNSINVFIYRKVYAFQYKNIFIYHRKVKIIVLIIGILIIEIYPYGQVLLFGACVLEFN
jgi:hypothetical protein